MATHTPDKLPNTLLAWYDAKARVLPWRVRLKARAAGEVANPYPVWLSEIMCQQTRIQTVIPYFHKFLTKWPDVQALAAANRDEVYQAWAGLGYYARARNLHACAKQIVALGAFPDTEKDWLALPGIGPYTAAAMMVIVHDKPANVVDGNVERVMARLFALATPLPAAKTELRDLAAGLVNDHRPGDYAQALMDLGALVCTPKSPDCPACPWQKNCAAHKLGHPANFPYRSAKKPRPERYGVAFVLVDGERVLLQKRAEKGLLGGMTEVMGTPWQEQVWSSNEARAHAPCPGKWQTSGEVRHVFTHFALNLTGMKLQAPVGFSPKNGYWVPIKDLHLEALPSLFKKLFAVCL